MCYQTANRYSETWEEAILQFPELIDHCRTFMLLLYFRTMDLLAGKECGATSRFIEAAVNSSGSPYFAAGLILRAFPNSPLLIWDPIQLVPLGQDDTKSGAYCRWPVRTWAKVKSVHYSGINGLAA